MPLPQYRWMPTVIYWVVLLLYKAVRKINTEYLAVNVLEAVASIFIAVMGDWFVVDGYIQIGLPVFDQSSLAFQLEVALFYVIVEIAVSLACRYQYKTRSSISNTSICGKASNTDAPYDYRGVDVSEKRLFAYEREFGGFLPTEYKCDLLLRSVFFAVMAIEDYNRSAGIRAIERIAFRFGLAKTTGIMQQKGGKPLSDKESVVLASCGIKSMWDNFLRRFARTVGSDDDQVFSFGKGWYRYNYDLLKGTLCESFSELYGDYCGTRLLDADFVFREVVAFEERNRYGLIPRHVVCCGSLFPAESKWFHPKACYWKDWNTVVCAEIDADSEMPVRLRLRASGLLANGDAIGAVIALMNSSKWAIDQVSVLESVVCCVECRGADEAIVPKLDDGWDIQKL